MSCDDTTANEGQKMSVLEICNTFEYASIVHKGNTKWRKV